MVLRLNIVVDFRPILAVWIVGGIVFLPGKTTTTAFDLSDADTLPPGPESVSVEPVLPLMLSVHWKMPKNHNSTSYNVTLNATNLFVTTNTSFTIDSHYLIYGGFYIVDVVACENDRCSINTSNSSATYPARPEKLRLIYRGVNDLRLQWEQPGGFSSVIVMVNYSNYTDVTNSISLSPPSGSGNVSHAVTCNITKLPTGGGRYGIYIAAAFMMLNSSSYEDFVYTRPEKPGAIMLVNRTTSEICVNWMQSGNAFNFDVGVNNTITSNVSVVPPSNNESSSVCYNCSWPVNLCISGLDTAGELYQISVIAKVRNLSSAQQASSQATTPSVPSSVRCSDKDNSSLTVLIGVPEKGKYEDFVITYRSLITNFSDNGTSTSITNHTIVNNLTAGVMYLVAVKAQSYSVFGDSINTYCTTIPNAPKEFSSTTLSASSIRLDWKSPKGYAHEYEIVYTNSSGFTQSVTRSRPPFVLESLSSDCLYDITISTRNFNVSSTNETSSNYTLPDLVSNLTVAKGHETEVVISWKPPDRHNNVGLYELELFNYSGNCVKRINLNCFNKQSMSHLIPVPVFQKSCVNLEDQAITCNGTKIEHVVTKLQHSTGYNISVAAKNPGGKGIPVNLAFETAKPARYEWIAGVVVGCFFGILVIILGFLLIHCWRNKKPPFSSKKSVSSGSDQGGLENPTYEAEPEPVLIQDFGDYVSERNQDSNYLFACEYLLLGKLSAKNPTTMAELPENRIKNRYTDVLPFDDSRVKLIPREDIGEGDATDYINASYLPGFNSKREYIAAQGPMKSTVDDFWLMIWQQKITTIVMVTNLCERGREKCEQYWPSNDDTKGYGDVSVELKSETVLEFYTLRVMEVSVNSEKRQLSHYHFLTWPDFGVPEEIEHILSFVTEVRENFKGKAPMLVHCSAGVGRTGTFIVVDHLLQLIRREQHIDLFHLVLDLRQHRPKMIQAESQYIFAHECIKMAISKGYHLRSSMYMTENDAGNGNCMYVNAAELTEGDPPLYANAESCPLMHSLQ